MREHDRTRSDRDRTSSGQDQTSGDQDQTWADRDQTSSESDQRSSDADQEAADEDLAAGGGSAVHDRTSLARERATVNRDVVSALREETAESRLATAGDRDQAAALRDRAAEAEDARARRQDLLDGPDAGRIELRLRAERGRERAALDRAKAAADRRNAAAERAEMLRIRVEAADVVKHATTDELTGARTREFGLEEAGRELERAHRTGAALVLAFVDVDGLKQVNDSQGHLAGDALLRLVGETLGSHVRPYDVIVRYGGDELICAMPNLSVPQASARFEQIAAALDAADPEHSITFGLAQAGPGDNLQELIARADTNLLDARGSDRQ